MSRTLYVGIDPGKTGGLAVIDGADVVECIEMPVTPIGQIDSKKLFTILKNFQESSFDIFCMLEKSQSMPKQGVKSTFSYGVSYGELLAVLKISETPFQEVAPMTWKKAFGLIKKTKADSCDVAKKLFPTESFVTPKGRFMDGKAEALLLADYARRRHYDIA
jgi:crossover junction endodeoxyribonuclease RuvC